MKAPATLDEFYRMFPTERRCWEVLRRVRWPHGFRCPRCEGAFDPMDQLEIDSCNNAPQRPLRSLERAVSGSGSPNRSPETPRNSRGFGVRSSFRPQSLCNRRLVGGGSSLGRTRLSS